MSIVSSDGECKIQGITSSAENRIVQIVEFSSILCGEYSVGGRVQFRRVQSADFVIKKVEKMSQYDSKLMSCLLNIYTGSLNMSIDSLDPLSSTVAD